MGLDRNALEGPTPTGGRAAISVLSFGVPNIGPEARPLQPEGLPVGSAGLGREYQAIAEEPRVKPGEVTLAYGGGYVELNPPIRLGYVDRARTVAGLHYIWTDEYTKMPISALPFVETGKPGDSAYGQLLHFKKREAMNGGWWAVIKGIGQNTGFVAQTKPDPPSSGETQQPPPRLRQTPWSLPGYTLEVPRPSTAGRSVVAVSVMPS